MLAQGGDITADADVTTGAFQSAKASGNLKTLLFKGFQVLPAPNGHTGIEFAVGSHPDVIILDLTMPDFSGIQVVENLRARPETKSIPILIHTGTVLSEPERQHLAAHVQSNTSKAEPASLLTELEHLDETPAEVVCQE